MAERHETAPAERELVVPVIQEHADVHRRQVETGVTRITRRVHEHSQDIDEPILRQHVEVRRVAVDRVVDAPMPARYEGDVLIVPVLEEQVVVTRRWILKEELHVSRRTVEEKHKETVTLRSEEVLVERQSHPDPEA